MPGKSHEQPVDFTSTSGERQRLRDLSQYYCATTPDEPSQSNEPFFSNASTLSSPGSVATWAPRPPRLAADPVLTTLTQSAALKLGVERCLVSLIDDRCQHVIAEATRSVSPFDINCHDEGDEILLGVQSLPFNWGVCSTVLSTFVNHSPIRFSQPGNISSPSGVLISDLVAEDRSCFTPVVLQNRQRLRFYAGVPLLSAAGRCIGVVCAFDPKPRPACMADLEKLQQSTAVISQYIAVMRLRMDNLRAEKLLQGMADFLHGAGPVDNKLAPVNARTDSPVQTSRSPSKNHQLGNEHEPRSGRSSASPNLTGRATRLSGQKETMGSKSAETSGRTAMENSVSADLRSTGTSSESPDVSHQKTEVPAQQNGSVRNNDRDRSVENPTTNIESVFSRSSRLIRECMELDGACFLEVSHKQRFRSMGRVMAADLTSGDRSSVSASDTSTTDDSSSEKRAVGGELPSGPRMSDCLGYSVADSDAARARRTEELSTTVPSDLLTKLTLLFPRGRIFHFDRHGGIGSSEDDASVPPSRGSKVGDLVAEHFEEARGLMFVPLYDYVGKHAYAGFVGWTNDPKRSLQGRELFYVAGFAHSIMSEVMRYQALELDKVKSAFITSISHELRSPLHGVLAANQLLSESSLPRDQNELVMAVDNCARTLLDVLNQLFDHAKITAFGRARRPHRKTQGKNESDKGSCTEKLPLVRTCPSVLLEDTISSLVVHDSHLSSPIFELDLSLANNARRASLPNRSPFVSVDIDRAADQQFWSHSGLWRTIIINLVGNAIKFTDGGYVHVTLRISKPSDGSSDVRIAELHVHDTGRGISEHFLRHRCFEPYAQEDNLSAGMGLGLSIVHRAVTSLRGTVAVDSAIGSGTTVVVQIPMQMVRQDNLDEPVRGDFVDSEFTAFRNTKFHIVQATDRCPDRTPMAEPPYERSLAWIRTQETLCSILTTRFGMENVPPEYADLVFVNQQTFQEQEAVYGTAGLDVVVVAHSQATDIAEGVRSANIVVLPSPLTPRSVLTALKRLNEQRAEKVVACDPEINGFVQEGVKLEETRASHYSSSSSGVEGVRHALRPGSLSFARPSQSLAILSMPSAEKKVVLLVDDNDINLRLLVVMMKKLKKQGFETITASDGQQAVDCFVDAVDHGRRIQFVFMDISMPIMDGMEATRRIRDHEKSRGLQQSARASIVAVTGLASARDKRNIFQSGIDQYIQKPVNLNVLRQILTGDSNDASPQLARSEHVKLS